MGSWDRSFPHLLGTQTKCFFSFGLTDAKIREALVLTLLDLLLGLKAFVFPMPDDNVRFVISLTFLRLFGVFVFFRFLFTRVVNPKHEATTVIGPLRGLIRADRHRLGNPRILFRNDVQ